MTGTGGRGGKRTQLAKAAGRPGLGLNEPQEVLESTDPHLFTVATLDTLDVLAELVVLRWSA